MSDSPNSTAAALAAALLGNWSVPADTSPVGATPEHVPDCGAELVVDRAVEVGLGRRPAVAAALSERGVAVTATDVVDREVPPGVEFVRDDVTDFDPSVYADADLVYSLNCPPELQPAALAAAEEARAVFRFTTLGGDPAIVPSAVGTVGDETLFTASPPKGSTRK